MAAAQYRTDAKSARGPRSRSHAAAVPIVLSIALIDEVLTAIARDQTAQAQKHDLAIETAPHLLSLV